MLCFRAHTRRSEERLSFLIAMMTFWIWDCPLRALPHSVCTVRCFLAARLLKKRFRIDFCLLQS